MIDFSRRSYKKELLDRDDIPFQDIAQNMRELNKINILTGGHKITIKGFRNLAGKNKIISVCEIGCGGGDNLAAIEKYCIKQKIELISSGIDINSSCIDFAAKTYPNPNTIFIASDYKKAIVPKTDIIFCSLFTHHLAEKDLIELIKWMQSNSTLGFFINDLRRHFISYYFIKAATKLFSRSYLVKNDAPLSVLRGFRKIEWINIIKNSGIVDFKIRREWAFRHLVIVKNQLSN